MFTYDAVLAVALLTSPATPLPVAQAAPWAERLSPHLIGLSLEGELLDRCEADKIFQRPVDFSGDLSLLQARFGELLDAPNIEECRRFPGCRQAKMGLALNRAVREELVARLPFNQFHAEELTHALAETDHLYQVWEEVRCAGTSWHYVTVRRQAMQRLRDLVGWEAFYRGQLPPCVPMHLLPVQR